jgi:CSLREA domain-containing protein
MTGRRQSRCILFGCSSIALGLAVLIAPRPALAATFAVDTTDDGVDVAPGDGQCQTANGHCTLRAAIQEANALLGADVVRLPAGNYLLARAGTGEDHGATGDLDITSSISITGDGAATTIVDADHGDRVFDILATGAAVITGVTIQNGAADDGAGIRVGGGTLKLVESAVTGNQASDAGGGIDNDVGVLELVRTTVSGNVAHGSGGGLANSGTAELRNATVSGNTADVGGGGLFNLGTATLNNATVTGNTLTGVDNGGQLVFMNTVLADNAGPDCHGALTSRGFNLIANTSGCTFEGDTSGDLLDKPANLGPLQDNGGPTFTHALLTGSAALDAGSPDVPGSGDPACEATDQRNVTRPQGARCDIGAFEGCPAAGSTDGAFTAPSDDLANCSSSCGNGVVDAGEQCDDGSANGTSNDPCDAKCHLVSPPGGSPGGAAVCGNGDLEEGEQCDDGNTDDGDGCSSTCHLESPLMCDATLCDHGCDARTRFKVLNCILQSPVCTGESLPGGVTKRIAKTREVLSLASQTEKPHRGKRLVVQGVRILKQADKLVLGVKHKGRLSRQCVADLIDLITKARHQCASWRVSF